MCVCGVLLVLRDMIAVTAAAQEVVNTYYSEKWGLTPHKDDTETKLRVVSGAITRSSHIGNWPLCDICHKADNGEDDEASEHTGEGIDAAYNDRVSVGHTHHSLVLLARDIDQFLSCFLFVL